MATKQSADTLEDGVSKKVMTAAERVTLAGLSAPGGASETDAGLVELATDAEALVGTDTARAITPANLTARLALMQSPRYRSYLSGRWYCAVAAFIPSSTAYTNGWQLAIPFWVGQTFTADRIACEVSVAAASSVVRLGIYNNAEGDVPGTVLLDAGTVDASTTGVKEITISQVLNPGLYWLVAAAQGGAPSLRTIGSTSQPPVVPTSYSGTSAAAAMNAYWQTGITGAFATWGASPVATFHGPQVKLRAA